MPAQGWIKPAEGCNRTPAEWEIARVDMVKAACVRPKVKCSACEDAVEKIAFEARIRFEKRSKVIDVVCV
jgi:hypothetical protein